MMFLWSANRQRDMPLDLGLLTSGITVEFRTIGPDVKIHTLAEHWRSLNSADPIIDAKLGQSDESLIVVLF